MVHLQITMVGKSIEAWAWTAGVTGQRWTIRQSLPGATWESRCGRHQRSQLKEFHIDYDVLIVRDFNENS